MLHAAHREAKRRKDVSSAYKIHAIILLGSGLSSEEVADVLFLSIDTLGNYVRKYVTTLPPSYASGEPARQHL